MEVVVEQRDGEDSPTAAACDALTEPPPVAAVVVIEHNVSSIEAALGDVLDSVGNVEAVGARPGGRPASGGLWSEGSAAIGSRSVLGSGVQISVSPI